MAAWGGGPDELPPISPDFLPAEGAPPTDAAVTVVRIVGLFLLVVNQHLGFFSGFRGQILSKLVGVGVGLMLVSFADRLVDWLFKSPV